MKIHASGEDYLEAVLVLQKNHGAVRSIDVARRVGVSKASVSYAVSALREGGFLTVDSDYVLHLTETGRNVAEKIYERHQVLTAGLIRLGYFNVTEEERQEGTSAARKYYLGLPITSSTLMIPLVYLLSVLLPGASTAILTLGVLVTGLLFIAPIHVKKPGLPALCALALIGAAELAGLIMLAL